MVGFTFVSRANVLLKTTGTRPLFFPPGNPQHPPQGPPFFVPPGMGGAPMPFPPGAALFQSQGGLTPEQQMMQMMQQQQQMQHLQSQSDQQ